MKLKLTVSLVLLGAVLVSFACGQSKRNEQTAPANNAGAATTSQSVVEGDFGVPECDQYMKKYLTCIDSKVPQAAQASLRQSLEQTRAAWKQAASTPEGRAALASGCTQAEAAAKQAMQAYGCQW